MPMFITPELITSADRVAGGIRTTFSSPGTHSRLKRGFAAAWLRGIQDSHGDVRLHQFVRATEALIQPRAGETRRQFIHRGLTFIGASEHNRELLGELFDLRSAAEHMNDLNTVFSEIPSSERNRRGWLTSYQAEVLAGRNYIRIFSNTRLLDIFIEDDSIDRFWKLPDAERKRLWGKPVDLELLAVQRHTDDPEPGPAPIQLS